MTFSEGGLTSHAAIVVRELRIPCIIGTKIATKMVDHNKILKNNWEFYLSRHLPVWHDTLEILKSHSAYRKYKLKKDYLELRVRHKLESDFYFPLTGAYTVARYIEKLKKNLEKKEYITFLSKQYKKDCSKFLNYSQTLKANSASLKIFLNWYGHCTSLLNITSRASKLLTDILMRELKNNPDRDAIISYYSVPSKLAPVQELEKEVEKFRGSKNLDKISGKLWQKYSWIPVGFVGEPWPKEYFLNLLKQQNKKHSPPVQKSQAKLSLKLKHLLWVLGQITYLNEYRKSIFCQVSHNIRPVFNKIATESGLKDWQDVAFLTHDEVIQAAGGKNFSKVVSRRKGEIFLIYNTDPKHVEVIYGSVVKKFENKFKTKNSHVSEFGGVVGNRGKVIGVVKIILNQNDFNKFKTGDILVAKMTSVDYLSIMKRAGAFVTDEGGLACHAAVVSREFGLPCIIGTKIATAVLKDGDKVEVDANKGLIRKI